MTAAANDGISLSTALNVQVPFQLTVLFTCGKEVVLISIASAILRDTAPTSTKAWCAWDSGSEIVPDTVEVMTLTQAGIQCPGSLLKKFLILRPRSVLILNAHSCRKEDGTVINYCFMIFGGFLMINGCALYFSFRFADVK